MRKEHWPSPLLNVLEKMFLALDHVEHSWDFFTVVGNIKDDKWFAAILLKELLDDSTE